MKSLRKPSCLLSHSLGLLTIVAGITIPALRAQDPPAPTMSVRKSDGSSIDLPYLSFDLAAMVAVFAAKDGGELRIPATELTIESLAKIASRIPPVAGWLAADKADLCVRSVGSLEWSHEQEACQLILDAAKVASSPKERIALLQLHGIVHGLLLADHERMEMEDINIATSLPKIRKKAQKDYEEDLRYAERHAINPLTKRDQKTPNVQVADAKLQGILRDCTMREQRSKREIMLRLASCNIFARYCEISSRAAYAKELDQLRAKVSGRKAETRESEPLGLAMLAWMSSRVASHHHTGNNAALLKGMFAKMYSDAKVEQASKMIFYERNPGDGYKLKALLVSLTGERLQPSHIGDQVLARRLRKEMRSIIPDESEIYTTSEQIMPFLEEAIRMGSR